MASDIIFRLDADLSDEGREDILSRVRDLPGVVTTALVRRGGKSALSRQLCFARLEPKVDAESLAQAVEAMPGVVRAEVPPKRGLADG